MITAVLSGLVVVVVILTMLVVGLLRSHATIVRALHNAGVNLDPDQHNHDLDPVPNHESAPTLIVDTPPSIRTIDGVPEPVERDDTRAHDLVGETPMGGTRSVAVQGKSNTLLAFLSTGCGTCATFWQDFRKGVQLPESTRLVIVTQSGNAESPADVAALAPSGFTTIMSSQAWDDYRVPVAPYFVMVNGSNGIIAGEGAAHSWGLVDRLLQRAVADAAAAKTPERMNRRDLLLGRNRANEIDAELVRAGIGPGDPRLYHDSVSTTTGSVHSQATDSYPES